MFGRRLRCCGVLRRLYLIETEGNQSPNILPHSGNEETNIKWIMMMNLVQYIVLEW